MKVIFCISFFILFSQPIFAQAWFNKSFNFRIVKQNAIAYYSLKGSTWEKMQCKDSSGVLCFSNPKRNFTLTQSGDSWYYASKKSTKMDTLAMHPNKNIDTTTNIPYWKGACFAGNYLRLDENEILSIDFRTIQYKTATGGGKWKQLRMPKYDMNLFTISGLDYDNKTITLQFQFPSCQLDNFKRVTGKFPPDDFVEYSEPPQSEDSEVEFDKPVTYFYSEKEKSVLFDVKTTFTKTEPEPGPLGWNLELKNNKTYYQDKEIPNVFWEAVIPQIHFNSEQGFVVETSKLSTFFKEKMSFMGFQTHEIQECAEYWKDRFTKKYVEICVAYVKHEGEKVEYNTNGFHYYLDFPETIEPQPDRIFRLCYYFRESDSQRIIPEPNLPQMNRKGFYVVEWGGVDVTRIKPL